MQNFLYLVVTAAVLCTCSCIENKPAESKRQLNNIRSLENLQYSLVLPFSKVSSFRSIGPRKIHHLSASRMPRLPPYAVPMEPIVQYSQKDPLYDQKIENTEDNYSQNELQAQSKTYNEHSQELSSNNNHIADNIYGNFYGGSYPAASLYNLHPRYYQEPEPIIEIIIKESNESYPAPAQTPPQTIVKKDPVQVFYVKYSEDPHGSGKLIYEKPVPAVTPPSNLAEHQKETFVTVTPEPQYLPQPTTTLRTIIKPESEIYHSEGGVKVTFGSEVEHHNIHNTHREDVVEGHEETAPQPSLAIPHQAQSRDSQISFNEQSSHQPNDHTSKLHRPPLQPHAQQRIQFQQPFLPHDQQLPRQQHLAPSFREPHRTRQGAFNQVNAGPPFPNVPVRPASSGTPLNYNKIPNGPPSLNARLPSSHPPLNFANRPPSFHSGLTRPFHISPQVSQIFNEPKYLQENYHTITTEQINPPKEAPIHSQNFNFVPRPTNGIPQPVPGPITPASRPNSFPERNQGFENPINRPVLGFSQVQQLPQQKPINHFDQNRHPNLASTNKQPLVQNFNQRPQENHQNLNIAHHHHQQPQFSFHPLPPQNKPNFRPNTIGETTTVPVFQPSSPGGNINHHLVPRPPLQSNQIPVFNTHHSGDQRNNHVSDFHNQNLGTILPQGGDLVASVPKYEHHIIENVPSIAPFQDNQNFQFHNEQTQQKQLPIQSSNEANHQQIRPQEQTNFFNAEQHQVQSQLAENVQKQQQEIQRLQTQLYEAQQQQHHQRLKEHNSNNQQNLRQQERFLYSTQVPQINERQKSQTSHQQSSTTSPLYHSSSLRTIKITPTTSKYSSSTINSVKHETNKPEKKNKPKVELPEEVPDDLRQQLLSSGILDNADISVLDYDKVGETPLESLPADQLANFFNAGGAQQLASSENKPVYVNKFGDKISVNFNGDQEASGSETVSSYINPSSTNTKKNVEMKVVHFDPNTKTGQKIASDYVQKDATRIDPVNLNDKKYNRYLPLKVRGNQFPVPDILKDKKITSVVVLAPVKSEHSNVNEHSRLERATENKLKEITFYAGESLKKLLKNPTKENFEAWLEKEKMTDSNQQSVVLLVTGNDTTGEEKEIFMYDIFTRQVNKLSGDLSQAFVEAAETNSLAEDIDKIAIAGEGMKEDLKSNKNKLKKENEQYLNKKDDDLIITKQTDDVPSYVNFSSVKINDNSRSKVSITSGYSKTKGA